MPKEFSEDCFEYLEELDLDDALEALRACVLDLDRRMYALGKSVESLEARVRRLHDGRGGL